MARHSLKEAIYQNRKRVAAKRREEWRKALADGRVVRFSSTMFTAYPTVEQAAAAVLADPDGAKIVDFADVPFPCE